MIMSLINFYLQMLTKQSYQMILQGALHLQTNFLSANPIPRHLNGTLHILLKVAKNDLLKSN